MLIPRISHNSPDVAPGWLPSPDAWAALRDDPAPWPARSSRRACAGTPQIPSSVARHRVPPELASRARGAANHRRARGRAACATRPGTSPVSHPPRPTRCRPADGPASTRVGRRHGTAGERRARSRSRLAPPGKHRSRRSRHVRPLRRMLRVTAAVRLRVSHQNSVESGANRLRIDRAPAVRSSAPCILGFARGSIPSSRVRHHGSHRRIPGHAPQHSGSGCRGGESSGSDRPRPHSCERPCIGPRSPRLVRSRLAHRAHAHPRRRPAADPQAPAHPVHAGSRPCGWCSTSSLALIFAGMMWLFAGGSSPGSSSPAG